MTSAVAPRDSHPHFDALDGWRAISISLVLLGHLLPLGPKRFELNSAVAATGMVLFFTLSGFLITTFLLRRPDVPAFLIRRFCRIVPLAWLYCLIVLTIAGADGYTWAAHLLYYGNLPPFWLIPPTAHLWSLALEMQFYVATALLVLALGRRGLWLLPFLGITVTAVRIYTGTEISIVTWVRADEIFAGCTLALVWHRHPGPGRYTVPWPGIALLLLLLLAAAHPRSGALNYTRPYLSAILVGVTLYSPGTSLVRLLRHRALAYLAKTSYALYVIHGGLTDTWLSSGGTIEKYAKRPLYFLVLFLLAHLSTFYFENRWINLGKRWSAHRKPQGVRAIEIAEK